MRNLTASFAFFLLVLTGCDPQPEKATATDKPINVRVQAVDLLAYKIPVRVTGRLSTSTEMKLSFKTGGIVKQLKAREGETVKRGDVLALLDLSEIQAQVIQAGIGLDKAQRDLTRAGNLYRDSVATLEQYQNAESAYELAKAQKRIADFNLEYSQIRAPTNGKILKLLVEASEMIAPGFPAILFASTENDWVVRVSVTDKDIVKLALGNSAIVGMDPFPGTEFKALVNELGTVADPVTGTYEAELVIVHPHSEFRTGFISRVDIYPRKLHRSLVVPIEALLDASDNTAHVFIYDRGKASRRRIRTGTILNDQVVVMDGISEGELVITDGAKYLSDNTGVNAVNLKDPSQP
ncbi:MAG: efflux RND transporter periplasmic adaptor subunit [Bacteroidota bacterium]